MKWSIGIDEAGRGALAGPVSVGAVLFPDDFDWKEGFALVQKRGPIRLRDSKQLSAQQRDILYTYITEHGRLKHAACLIDAKTIDEIGIVNATHEAAEGALKLIDVSPSTADVLLDAGLRVPSEWRQQSFIRGDENIPAISFASIIAKVTRDRWMESLSEKYSHYGLADHKGYGTQVHIKAIKTLGPSDIHRRSFLGSILARA